MRELPKKKNYKNALVIWDDFMVEFCGANNKFFAAFVTRKIHHQSVSSIYTTQNLFSNNHRSVSYSFFSIKLDIKLQYLFFQDKCGLNTKDF